MSRSSKGQGHNVACLWKGIYLSNNVCEYKVNWLTNVKVISRGWMNTFLCVHSLLNENRKDSWKKRF